VGISADLWELTRFGDTVAGAGCGMPTPAVEIHMVFAAGRAIALARFVVPQAGEFVAPADAIRNSLFPMPS